jgi:hypothetical protein
VVMRGLARDCANRDTTVYLGSGPSRVEVKPPTSCLLRIIWIVSITLLLELFGLEEEEEDRIP